MKKSLKTKIAFASILSFIPLVVLVKLQIISEGIGVLLVVIALILFLGFGREWMDDLDRNYKK